MKKIVREKSRERGLGGRTFDVHFCRLRIWSGGGVGLGYYEIKNEIMALEMGKRNASSEQERKLEASTDRFEQKMGNDPAKIRENAIFENYLREEIKERKIPVTDNDISKIISFSTYRFGGGEPATYKMDKLETIDSVVNSDPFRSNKEELALNLETKGSPRRPMTDTEVEAFLKRYPPELAGAVNAAQKRAKVEIENIDANKTIDEL